MKKYELTSETKVVSGTTLYRIRALRDFDFVKAGELGGFVEKEANLSQYNNAWVYGNAEVSGDARVSGNAEVSGDARVSKLGDIYWVGGIGSRNGTTTFFMCEDKKIRVSCGCFYGDLKEFAEKLKQTHGDNEYAKVYELAIEMAKVRIGGGADG